MQAHAEHQEDDTDFGKLWRECGVTDKTRRKRPHRNARQEVPDNGRNAEPRRDRTENESETETDDNDGDEWLLLFHGPLLAWKREIGVGHCRDFAAGSGLPKGWAQAPQGLSRLASLVSYTIGIGPLKVRPACRALGPGETWGGFN